MPRRKSGAPRTAKTPRITAVEVFLYRIPEEGAPPEYLVLARESGLWQPACGKIEPKETPLQAAWREVLEETGIKPVRVLPSHWADPFVDPERGNLYLLPVFVAEAPPGVEPALGTEHVECEWLPFEAALKRLTYHGYREALRASEAMRVSEGVHHRPSKLNAEIGAEPPAVAEAPRENRPPRKRRRRRSRRGKGGGGPPGGAAGGSRGGVE